MHGVTQRRPRMLRLFTSFRLFWRFNSESESRALAASPQDRFMIRNGAGGSRCLKGPARSQWRALLAPVACHWQGPRRPAAGGLGARAQPPGPGHRGQLPHCLAASLPQRAGHQRRPAPPSPSEPESPRPRLRRRPGGPGNHGPQLELDSNCRRASAAAAAGPEQATAGEPRRVATDSPGRPRWPAAGGTGPPGQ